MMRLLRTAVALMMTMGVVLLGPPALASTSPAGASIDVLGAHLLTGGKSVRMAVAVTCHTPAGATSYLSTTIWQSYYLNPDYREAQGQSVVTCDRHWHIYYFVATLTAPFADFKLTVGRAGTESGVQYCVPSGPDSAFCTLAADLHRERVYIHR